MAPRVAPAPLDADNSAGSFTLAACNDWRCGVADSMSGRTITSPLQMPDIRLQPQPFLPSLSISLFLFGGSPYTRLGVFIVIAIRKVALETRKWMPGDPGGLPPVIEPRRRPARGTAMPPASPKPCFLARAASIAFLAAR